MDKLNVLRAKDPELEIPFRKICVVPCLNFNAPATNGQGTLAGQDIKPPGHAKTMECRSCRVAVPTNPKVRRRQVQIANPVEVEDFPREITPWVRSTLSVVHYCF